MLETVWFLLWGLLWIIYFVLDGFDFGIGMLMPFIAKNEQEKKTIYKVIAPFWDGNEVWLITAGGVTFAAFPKTYAVMFSGLYTALMLLLIAIIIRGISIEFRNKSQNPSWKTIWDIAFFISSLLPALLLGVAFANIFKGIPIDENGVFHGTLLTLLNPYALVGGIVFVFLFLEHGALWLALKSSGELESRTEKIIKKTWPIKTLLIVLFLIYSVFATKLFSNYLTNPILFIVPVVAIIGLISTKLLSNAKRWLSAWISSGITIAGFVFYGLIGMYPAMLISSINPAYSVTIYNSSSSPLTLKIMLTVAVIFVPIVVAYQLWSYKTFHKPLTEEEMHY